MQKLNIYCCIQLFVILILFWSDIEQLNAFQSQVLSEQVPISETQEATQAMVVCDQAIASKVGIDILKKGGNAIDAAVAVGYAMAVVQPCCGNIGGGGFMLIHLSSNNARNGPRDIVINFREKAPLLATENMFLEKEGNPNREKSTLGYLAVAVPGTVLGLDTALQKYGTMSREAVMAPAIQLAEQGFQLTPESIRLFAPHLEQFRKEPNVKKIFLKQDKPSGVFFPYRVGDRLIQSNLANTLKLIASEGPDAFYRGSIAKAITEASTANGGILSLQDFERYTIQEMEPLRCNYHGYQIITTAPPSGGGVGLCQMLSILQGFPLATLGFTSLFGKLVIIETMKQAFKDRNLLGDPNFVENPIQKLLSPEYSIQIQNEIQQKIQGNIQEMIPEKMTSQHSGIDLNSHAQDIRNTVKNHSTTHFSIIDKDENIVSLTYTINSHFGAKVIPGELGFFLNNEMDDFSSKLGAKNQFGLEQGTANAIAPGKRPLSSMSPTIIMKDEKPYLILGAAGGSYIATANLLTILNVLDYQMSIQAAVNAPRFHSQNNDNIVEAEPEAFTLKHSQELRQMGYDLKYKPKIPADVEAIMIKSDPKRLNGASDPRRRNGAAIGY